jgi:hypothetical protein
MTGMWKLPYQRKGWIFVFSALIFIVSSAYAFDLPDFKSLKLPSFRYGKLKRDREVNRIFQNFVVLEDHRYYTVGQGNIPHAIIGIQNGVKHRQGLWKKVEPNTPLMRSWITSMDNIYGYPPYGCRILDDKEQRLGIWYSSKQWTTVIIEDNNEIAVLAPEPPGFGKAQ